MLWDYKTLTKGFIIEAEMKPSSSNALEKLMQNSYDLILMDVQMPEMDGLEATTIIRNQFPPDKKDIPVLAMTAGALQTEINKCFAAGMNDFITKPIVVDTLIRKISIHYYSVKNKA